MAPSNSTAVGGSLVNHTLTPSSLSTETIVNIIFGVFALAVGIGSIWQGARFWKLWHAVPQSHQLNGTASLFV